MKTLVIVGAGQMGRASAELLNPNKVKLLAFGDNDPALQGSEMNIAATAAAGAVQIMSVEEAVALQPQEILISVLGEERAQALAQQISALGYNGEVRFLKDSYELFDIRSRVLGQLAVRIKTLDIPGAAAELGVYRGDTAWQLNALLPDRELYLFDTFEGFDIRDCEEEDSPHATPGRFSDTSEEDVMARMPHPEKVRLVKGFFPASAREVDEPAFALVSLDPDLYAPTLEGLKYFYPRLSPGGMIVVHDYENRQFEGVKQAVTEYEEALLARGKKPLRLIPLADLHGSCVIVK